MRDIPANLKDAKVGDLVDQDGNWKWNLIREILPYHYLMKIAAVYPPRRDARPDCIIWNDTPTGSFSSKSAYVRLEKDNWEGKDIMWKTIWD